MVIWTKFLMVYQANEEKGIVPGIIFVLRNIYDEIDKKSKI